MSANDYDWGRYRQSASEKPLLDASRERALLERAKRGDRQAMSELVDSHQRLVVQIASRYSREGLSAHDLMAEGMLGLLEATLRFDLARESRFASYATWWVRAYVRRHALQNRRIVGMPNSRGARIAASRIRSTERGLTQALGRPPSRSEIAQALEVSEQDVELVLQALSARDTLLFQGEADATFELPDASMGPEEALADAELRAERACFVHEAFEDLSGREQAVVRGHLYSEDSRSLAEIGRGLGVSRQRAGQILAGAREKLRARLARVA